MGAFIDLLISFCEGAFVFIAVTPDGVVALGVFGEGVNFRLCEFFHFFGDIHRGALWHKGEADARAENAH